MAADWDKQISKMLEEYSGNITEELGKIIDDTAKKGRNTIRKKSPKKTGHYKRGWSVQKTREGKNITKAVIYNKTDYQLTHLLENGHVNRDGTFTAPRPHIAEVEQEIKEQYIKDVENMIKEKRG